jgi:PRC-barrel domain
MMNPDLPPQGDEPVNYTGHRVLDESGRPIGRISDVVYDDRSPRWLVVDVGFFGVSHYAPAAATFQTIDGDVVAPFTKDDVKTAPKAHRDHVLTRELEAKIADHYAMS